MFDKIKQILINKCRLQQTDTLLVGVSGGPDSLFLLHVLHHFGYPLVAMHINHQLRPEAEAEVEIVHRLTEQIGVELKFSSVDVNAYVQKNSVTVEEGARILRYRILFEQAKDCNAKAVVVGHNADDQVETILMHLLRGTGLSGLRGMEFRSLPNTWSEEIPLVRPLLNTWRGEIQGYLEEQHLQPVCDKSNLDETYLRNRVRHELIPLLKDYNPAIQEGILRMGRAVADDYSVIEQLTDQAWKSSLIQQGVGFAGFDTTIFLNHPISIQRQLLRRAIQYHIPGLIDVGFDCIDRGIQLLSEGPAYSQTDLLGGITLVKEGPLFWVASGLSDLPVGELPDMVPGLTLSLYVPSTLNLSNVWSLHADEDQSFNLTSIQETCKVDPFQAWLDLDQLELPLIVRTRKQGDIFKPIGLKGHSLKIADIMINLKLPERVRDHLPLVCSGDVIVWVPGYRSSHSTRLTADTTRAIHLRLNRLNT
jgi:tRNA(Ile)-lysidine synthase